MEQGFFLSLLVTISQSLFTGSMLLWLVKGAWAWVAEGLWRLSFLKGTKGRGWHLLHDADFDEGRLKRAHRDGLIRQWDRESDKPHMWAVFPSDACLQRIAQFDFLEKPVVPLKVLAFCRFDVKPLRRRKLPEVPPNNEGDPACPSSPTS